MSFDSNRDQINSSFHNAIFTAILSLGEGNRMQKLRRIQLGSRHSMVKLNAEPEMHPFKVFMKQNLNILPKQSLASYSLF